MQKYMNKNKYAKNAQASSLASSIKAHQNDDLNFLSVKNDKGGTIMSNETQKNVEVVNNVKEFTINELARKIGFSNGAVRNWALKVNVGDTFTENYINIKNIKEQLSKNFEPNRIKELLGCNLDELKIIKGVRVERNYIEVNDLEVGSTYIIRNYHYETECTYLGSNDFDDETLFVFKTIKGEYKTYNEDQLTKENTHIVEL